MTTNTKINNFVRSNAMIKTLSPDRIIYINHDKYDYYIIQVNRNYNEFLIYKECEDSSADIISDNRSLGQILRNCRLDIANYVELVTNANKGE